jgi:cytochrome c553
MTLARATSLAAILFAGSAAAEGAKPAAAPQKPAAAALPTVVVKPAVSQKEVQAKASYCMTCHGSSGQGFYGAVPVPRLAGQSPEYIEYELLALKEHRRVDHFMSEVVRGVTPEMAKALSTQFKDLNPAPASVGPRELAPEGKKIFEEGIPEAEVPPCSACHGDDAKGSGEFPRLAGQLQEYLMHELDSWDQLRGLKPDNPDNAAIMSPIVHKLTERQKTAVAAYVSGLK